MSDSTRREKARKYNRNILIAVSVAVSLHIIIGFTLKTMGDGGRDYPDFNKYIRSHPDTTIIYLTPKLKTDPLPIPDKIKVVKPVPEHSIPVVTIDDFPDFGDYDGFSDPIIGELPSGDTTVVYPPSSDTATGEIHSSAMLYKEAPEYPKLAMKMGIEGTVILYVDIDEQGKISEISIYQTSGSEILDEAATRAVKKSIFSPAINNGKALKSRMKLTYKFILKNNSYIIDESFE
ncbi:MAG: energy transducer TonB [bacterium]|nr:energy transducer TonB [bacterium]